MLYGEGQTYFQIDVLHVVGEMGTFWWFYDSMTLILFIYLCHNFYECGIKLFIHFGGN